MIEQALAMRRPGSIRARLQVGKWKRALAYLLMLLIPYLGAMTLGLDGKGAYSALLGFLNVIAMMAFFIQFPLAGRLKALPLFSNINWSMARHKQLGKWLGIFFLLHPLLILAPRFMISPDDGLTSLLEALTSPQLLTGIVAWAVMIVWVLLSIFRDRLGIRYETWRLTHLLGFIAVCVLATLHVTSVGRHGQFDTQFNLLWWSLCSLSVLLVLYNQTLKKTLIKQTPFTLTGVSKLSRSDWLVTLECAPSQGFHFEAGQFIWMNTSGSVYNLSEHPFSIASCKTTLPEIALIIRELGDYTARLDELVIGQRVYVDGPYGSLSLRDAERARGITLIAGGAGIGPMLSLLRELAAQNDGRPIRLLYGNREMEQMVLQEEIASLQQRLPDFAAYLVCERPSGQEGVRQGLITQPLIAEAMAAQPAGDWAVYLCGPEAMIASVRVSLRSLGVREENVHYEQLSF